MSTAARIIQFMTRRGMTESERRALSPTEKEVMADIAFENGYGFARDVFTGRWFFVRVKSPREVQAMHSMWKRGPRKRPHPRSRRRK